MEFAVLHPWMLLGLAGVALPVLVHLLSRRKYDIVNWGAMQFLELDPSSRRRLRLEHFWLLLVRMGLIALLVLALARPWTSHPLLSRLQSSPPRDLVLILDGSASMGLSQGGAVSLQALAKQQALLLLDSLKPGDTLALLELRDQLRAVIDPPTRDFQRVREALEQLPPPSGASQPPEGIVQALQQLTQTTNLKRDVILFTDAQANGWHAGDANLWSRIDELRKQPAVTPGLWVVNVADAKASAATNFSVDRLQLSRELTVADFPIRVSTKIRLSGADQPTTQAVHLEIDGERLTDRTVTVRLSPNGETTVQFEQRFQTPGPHLIAVVLDHDAIPADNRSEAVLVVAPALPVWLVHDDANPDPVKQETFFAQAALTSPGNDTPWIRARTVTINQLAAEKSFSAAVIVLANVSEISEPLAQRLREYVDQGGGLLITLGDRSSPELLHARLGPLLPQKLTVQQQDDPKNEHPARIANDSLQVPWLEKFRHELGGTLTESQVSHWWRTEAWPEKNPTTKNKDVSKSDRPPIVAARLSNGDPLLILHRQGEGQTALITTSLDADWNSLPAKPDYVAWLHEILFVLAARAQHRNVECGEPLALKLADSTSFNAAQPHAIPRDWQLERPHAKPQPITFDSREKPPLLRWNETPFTGVYTFTPLEDPAKREPFVVNYDHRESELTPLSDEERKQLSLGDRLKFVDDPADLKSQLFDFQARTEFWFLLLWLFVGFLVLEVWMTRRLVQGGQAVV